MTSTSLTTSTTTSISTTSSTTSSTSTSSSSSTSTSTTSSTSTSTTSSTSSSTTTTTSTSSSTSSATTTTTTSITNAEIFWGFDNSLQDLYNNFNGVANNGPTYQSPSYSGIGTCLQLNQSSSQSVTVNSPPFLSMFNRSFTFEVWLYGNSFYNHSPYTYNYIVGQCDQNTADRCLQILIRNQKAFFGFFQDDTTGNQVLSAGQWYHMAFIYDYSTYTQLIYVNGILDVSRSTAEPYLGTSGNLTIGTGYVNSPNNFFDGCLDSIAYYPWTKNASEILNDATLVAYLKFDGNTLLDSGPLLINGTGTNYSYTSLGRVNQALTLSILSSYAQVIGLTRLGTSTWPYTVSIWIYPTNTSGGTIMHVSTRPDGAQTSAWCLPIMGLTSVGEIAINSWNHADVSLNGPLAPLLTWTHVAATYSQSNGERLYVNGSQYGASSMPYAFQAGGVPMALTLGSSLLGTGACSTGTIQMGQFYGWLDEFRIYARELSPSEVYALANP